MLFVKAFLVLLGKLEIFLKKGQLFCKIVGVLP